jgi:predicted  nucleic acid-binding Zn-ribbon protein
LRSYVTGQGTRLETLNKLEEENQSLKQKMQELGNENPTLNSELGKTQKELEESKFAYETKLKEFNKENESPRQEIKNLKN